MAMRPSDTVDSLISAFNTMFPGSEWVSERSATERATHFGFRCRAKGSVLVSDATIEDTIGGDRLLAQIAEDLYSGRHRMPDPVAKDAFVECAACRMSSPVRDMSTMTIDEQYAHCERMAVLWMERAAKLQKDVMR